MKDSITADVFNSMAYTFGLAIAWSLIGLFVTFVFFAEISIKSGFISFGVFGFVLFLLIKVMINEYRAGDISLDPDNPYYWHPELQPKAKKKGD